MGRIVPCALGALVYERKLALGLRAKEPCLGLWNAPGGKQEPLEFSFEGVSRAFHQDPIQTIEKEYREETGLEVIAHDLLYSSARSAPEAHNSKTYVINMFLCELKEGQHFKDYDISRVCNEAGIPEFKEYVLFSYDELLSYRSEGKLVDHIGELLVPELHRRKLI